MEKINFKYGKGVRLPEPKLIPSYKDDNVIVVYRKRLDINPCVELPLGINQIEKGETQVRSHL